MAEDHRRKQLLYRANHRGIKEMDLILGGFATARLDTPLFHAILEQAVAANRDGK